MDDQRRELLRGFLKVYSAGVRSAAVAAAEPAFFDWSTTLPPDARARARRSHVQWTDLFDAHRRVLLSSVDLPYEELCLWASAHVFGEDPEWLLRAYLGGGASGAVFLAERRDAGFAAVKVIANDPLDEAAPPEHEMRMAHRFHAAGVGLRPRQERISGFVPCRVARRDHARLFRGPNPCKTRRALRSFLGWYAVEAADGTLGDLLEGDAPPEPAATARSLADLLRRTAAAGLVHGDAHQHNVGRLASSFFFLDFGRSASSAELGPAELLAGQAADCAVLLSSLDDHPALAAALLVEFRAGSALASCELPAEAAALAREILGSDAPRDACRKLEKLYLRALDRAFERPLSSVDLGYVLEDSDASMTDDGGADD